MGARHLYLGGGRHTVPSRVTSPVFSMGGFKFKLLLYSNQTGEEYKDFTGLFLQITKGWKAHVKWEFQIISANDRSISKSQTLEYTFERLAGFGAGKQLTNHTLKSYLKKGKVTVRAKVSVEMPEELESALLLT
jgi:hypothetical protein